MIRVYFGSALMLFIVAFCLCYEYRGQTQVKERQNAFSNGMKCEEKVYNEQLREQENIIACHEDVICELERLAGVDEIESDLMEEN